MPIVVNLEPRDAQTRAFSDFFPDRITPDQLPRFLDGEQPVALPDTSYIVAGIFQRELWAMGNWVRIIQQGCAMLVMPRVITELASLAERHKQDGYGLAKTVPIPNDLTIENTTLAVNIPQGIEDMVRDTWERTVMPYKQKRYEGLRNRGESASPPTISETDVQLVCYALFRSTKGLSTVVLTADRDISGTLRAAHDQISKEFGHELALVVLDDAVPLDDVIGHPPLNEFALLTGATIAAAKKKAVATLSWHGKSA